MKQRNRQYLVEEEKPWVVVEGALEGCSTSNDGVSRYKRLAYPNTLSEGVHVGACKSPNALTV